MANKRSQSFDKRRKLDAMEVNTPILEILIPTYNRDKFLLKNLDWLSREIRAHQLNKNVSIIISNNHSTDDTVALTDVFINNNSDISISLYNQKKNIGLEPNVVDLMSKATSPYIMWTGDDDYIAKGYLKFCIDQIKQNQKIGCIIPGLENLYADGSVKKARLETFETRELSSGFESMKSFSHLAHQMSGILLNREYLLENYLSYPHYRNPYLFIYWTSHCLYHKGGVYAPKYKTSITSFNEKDWGYNSVGLLDEVFKSFYPFIDKIGEKNVSDLMLRFSVMHSYRYGIDIFSPIKLIRQYIYLCQHSKSASGFKRKLAIQLIKEYISKVLK